MRGVNETQGRRLPLHHRAATVTPFGLLAVSPEPAKGRDRGGGGGGRIVSSLSFSSTFSASHPVSGRARISGYKRRVCLYFFKRPRRVAPYSTWGTPYVHTRGCLLASGETRTRSSSPTSGLSSGE
ncbi:hypothetical protein PUN28_014450 [Cardiocondyla obscurior]|uniref:Uncharacterized protein n=1 Tax=Cardiocondyla obscurior TaxID=286306 RepID=A0AAW2F2L7_9HYME